MIGRRMAARQREDRQLESTLRIKRSDSRSTYSPADIKALEEERVPWLREKRRLRG